MTDAFHPLDVKIGSPELVFDQHIKIKTIDISLKENCQWSKKKRHYFVECTNKIAALPYDPYANTVVFTEKFRVGTFNQKEGLWHLEIPTYPESPTENHAVTLQKALSKDIQCEGLDSEFIADFYTSPALSNEQVFLYCTGIDSSQTKQNSRIEVLTLPEAMDAIYGNYFQDASTIMSLHWLFANQERLKQKWQ